jgi:plasmid maintenance system antidote protein VapI
MEKQNNNRKQTIIQPKDEFTNLTIGPNDSYLWTEAKAAKIAALAKARNSKRSPSRVRRNDMLAVYYRMEHYLNDNKITADDICQIEDFVKEFLSVLCINKTAFANYIEIDISNLNKYYSNNRRFNSELALKFGHFFHTPANIWLQIQAKNEILILQKEEQAKGKYAKYDYEKLLQIA